MKDGLHVDRVLPLDDPVAELCDLLPLIHVEVVIFFHQLRHQVEQEGRNRGPLQVQVFAQVLGQFIQYLDLMVVYRNQERRHAEEGYVFVIECDRVPDYREFEVELFLRLSDGEVALLQYKVLDYGIVVDDRSQQAPQLVICGAYDVDPSGPAVFYPLRESGDGRFFLEMQVVAYDI